MAIKLFGGPNSTVSKRVAVVLHEKNIPFEFHQIDSRNAEHKTPEYKAKQPFGQMPYLDDDGFIVYESRAICRYLEDKYSNQGTKLVPSDIRQRALFEQGVSIETSNFDVLAVPLIYEAIIKQSYFGQTPDPAKIEELKASLAAKLDVYEEILTKQKYIGGNSLTLADFFHLPCGSMLPNAGVDLIQKWPHVAKWLDELQNRPSWQAVKDGLSNRA